MGRSLGQVFSHAKDRCERCMANAQRGEVEFVPVGGSRFSWIRHLWGAFWDRGPEDEYGLTKGHRTWAHYRTCRRCGEEYHEAMHSLWVAK